MPANGRWDLIRRLKIKGKSSKSAQFWDPKMFKTVSRCGYKCGCCHYNTIYIKT